MNTRAFAPQKTRIALFLVGGLGGGFASQGVPAIAAITRALADGFDVSVYSLLPPDAGFRPEGYRLHSPPRWLGTPLTKKLRWSWLAVRFLAAHRTRPYEVLFSYWAYPMGLFVVALAELVRRPSVVTTLGAETAAVPSIAYGHMRRPITRGLVLETCSRASIVVALSAQQRTNLHRHGLRRQDVRVIPFGVDRNLFQRKPTQRHPPLKILHVANLTEVKDQPTLIRAFSLLRRNLPATLRIVGPDHLDGKLQRMVAQLGLQQDVAFLGPLPYASIPAQYEWADMFVLTSLSEGQGSVLAEAAMSVVLQVSTPVGCVLDQGDDTAVIVRMADPDDIAHKIRAIAEDEKAWERKVSRARVWAEGHDLQWTVERLRGVINEASTRS